MFSMSALTPVSISRRPYSSKVRTAVYSAPRSRPPRRLAALQVLSFLKKTSARIRKAVENRTERMLMGGIV